MPIDTLRYKYFIRNYFIPKNWNTIVEWNILRRYFPLLHNTEWLSDKEKIWICLWIGIFWRLENNKGFPTVSDTFNRLFITTRGEFIYDYEILKKNIDSFNLAKFIPSSHVYLIWENIGNKRLALLSIVEYFCKNIDTIVLDFKKNNFLSIADRFMHTTSEDWKISKFKWTYTIDCARIIYISFPEILRNDCFLDLYYLFNKASRNVKKWLYKLIRKEFWEFSYLETDFEMIASELRVKIINDSAVNNYTNENQLFLFIENASCFYWKK